MVRTDNFKSNGNIVYDTEILLDATAKSGDIPITYKDHTTSTLQTGIKPYHIKDTDISKVEGGKVYMITITRSKASSQANATYFVSINEVEKEA